MWLKFCRPAWRSVGVVCTVKIEIPGGGHEGHWAFDGRNMVGV